MAYPYRSFWRDFILIANCKLYGSFCEVPSSIPLWNETGQCHFVFEIHILFSLNCLQNIIIILHSWLPFPIPNHSKRCHSSTHHPLKSVSCRVSTQIPSKLILSSFQCPFSPHPSSKHYSTNYIGARLYLSNSPSRWEKVIKMRKRNWNGMKREIISSNSSFFLIFSTPSGTLLLQW